ncbi:hypothetical protein KC19_2G157900 [Ceratodon purpureus]|uniref:Uncharacterized protein n=1 Tax=Ceratodon purpureus TaxID=3225 RepID=A0A8T0IW48_CERPU|nr:hypothetical protein KC19_2G157900 [Ceratodon purpureus]
MSLCISYCKAVACNRSFSLDGFSFLFWPGEAPMPIFTRLNSNSSSTTAEGACTIVGQGSQAKPSSMFYTILNIYVIVHDSNKMIGLRITTFHL